MKSTRPFYRLLALGMAFLLLFHPQISFALRQENSHETGLEENLQARLRQPVIFGTGLEESAQVELDVESAVNQAKSEQIAIQKIKEFEEYLKGFPLFALGSPLELVGYQLGRSYELDVKKRGGSLQDAIALAHVIHNSVDAIADKSRELGEPFRGRIRMWVERTPQGIVLALADNGIGYRLKTLSDLFTDRLVSTKNPLLERWIGGLGEAIRRGYYGDRLMAEFDGSIEIDTNHSVDGARRLHYDPKRHERKEFFSIDRSETGMVIRWFFPTPANGTRRISHSAGMEEGVVRQGRVVVVDAALIEQSAGLEEFLRRIEGIAPAPYPDRVIVLGSFSGLQGRIQTVQTEEQLGVLLAGLEERIPSLSLIYLGLEERIPHLQALLRGHPNVTFHAPYVRGKDLFALLSAGLGMPEELAGKLATGLEEAEVRGRAA